MENEKLNNIDAVLNIMFCFILAITLINAYGNYRLKAHISDIKQCQIYDESVDREEKELN